MVQSRLPEYAMFEIYENIERNAFCCLDGIFLASLLFSKDKVQLLYYFED
jgi:hypothetical protein